MLLDVIKVETSTDYKLFLEFENGEKRCFDMAKYINELPWKRIKDINLFQSAFTANGTVVWEGDIDIDPETLYECSEAA